MIRTPCWSAPALLGLALVVGACGRGPAGSPAASPVAEAPATARPPAPAGQTAAADKLTVPAPADPPLVEAGAGGGPGAETAAGGEGLATAAPAAATAAPAAVTAAPVAAASDGSVATGQATARPAGWRPEDPRAHPLSIEQMRGLAYPGSALTVVQDLEPGANYSRQVVSYESEGYTIRALLTVPTGDPPASGWPVVIFNHGYIPPAQYRTTERYVAYQDAFARAGYITFKSDYRGHGSSEGEATSGRSSPAYTIDVLNGLASLLTRPDADPNRVGMWGHSMGGSITLRAMVVSRQIKAGVIWAGVVASYPDMFRRLGQGPATGGNPNPAATGPNRRGWRLDLVERFGTPEENPAAWDAVSPNAFLADISGPLQLHHGSNDHSVPLAYSQRLQAQMEAAGRPSELFVYEGDDHNLKANLRRALDRSVAFFDQQVKGAAPGG